MTDNRKITLEFPSLRAFLGEYGARISAEGMLLQADPPPDVGSEVDVEVVLAGGLPLLRARGETLWRGWTGAGGKEYGAAIRFRELDDASRTLIGKVVEQRRRAGEPAFELSELPRPRGSRLRDLTVPAGEAFGEPPEAAPSTGDTVFDLATAPPRAELPQPPGPESELLKAVLEELEPGTPEPAEPEPTAFEPEAPEPEMPALELEMPELEELELAEPELGAGDEPGELPGAEGPSAGAPVEPPPAVTKAGAADALFADLPAAAPVVVPGVAPLEPEPPAAAPALESEPATEEPLPEDSPAGADLSDLFGGKKPQSPLRGGLTDPFPPSFVDEVEAELEASEPAASSSAVLDTSQLEVDHTEPSSPPVTAEPQVEITPAEASPAQTEPPQPPPEVDARAPAVSEAAASEVPPIPEPEVPPIPEPEVPPIPEPEVPAIPEPEVPAIPELEVPAIPEPEMPAIPEPALEPPSMPPPDTEPTSPPPLAELEPPASLAGAAEPPPGAPGQDLGSDSLEVTMGAETVELPLPKAVRRSPPPDADESLLAIPELDDGAPRAPAPEPHGPPAPSAAALRGAAGRSRHFGTGLLIGLLTAALAVAGYFALGLLRGGDQADTVSESPAARPPIPAPEAAGEPATTVAGEPAEPAAAVPPSPEEVAAAEPVAPPPVSEAPAPPPVSEVAALPPPATLAPWGGLERITWSERDGETLVTLVADGAIAPEQLETIRLTSGDPRLVIKLSGAKRPFRPTVLEVGTGQVLRIRTGLHAGGQLHVVVDLADPAIGVRSLEPRGSRLELRLGPEGG